MIDDEAADFLADVSGGDARAALNAVELGVLTTERDQADGLIHITLEAVSYTHLGPGVKLNVVKLMA